MAEFQEKKKTYSVEGANVDSSRPKLGPSNELFLSIRIERLEKRGRFAGRKTPLVSEIRPKINTIGK